MSIERKKSWISIWLPITISLVSAALSTITFFIGEYRHGEEELSKVENIQIIGDHIEWRSSESQLIPIEQTNDIPLYVIGWKSHEKTGQREVSWKSDWWGDAAIVDIPHYFMIYNPTSVPIVVIDAYIIDASNKNKTEQKLIGPYDRAFDPQLPTTIQPHTAFRLMALGQIGFNVSAKTLRHCAYRISSVVNISACMYPKENPYSALFDHNDIRAIPAFLAVKTSSLKLYYYELNGFNRDAWPQDIQLNAKGSHAFLNNSP